MQTECPKSFCRLCGLSCGHFVRSHLIPWGFIKGDEFAHQMSLVSSDGQTKRMRKGLYAEHILCDACEHRYFHAPDTYAIQMFRDFEGAAKKSVVASDGRQHFYYDFEHVDRRLLRAFFASVLWRCSVARHEIATGVDVGEKYEKLIVSDLMNGGEFGYIDATGVRFDASNQDEIIAGLNHGFVFPERTRLRCANRTANGYNVYFPGLKFCVSLDQRQNPFVAMSVDDPLFYDASVSLGKDAEGKRLLLFESDYPTSLAKKIAAVCRNQRECSRHTN